MRENVIGARRAAGCWRAALRLVGRVGSPDRQRAAPVRRRFGGRRAGRQMSGRRRRCASTRGSGSHAAGRHANLSSSLRERDVFTFPGKQKRGKQEVRGIPGSTSDLVLFLITEEFMWLSEFIQPSRQMFQSELRMKVKLF